MKWLPLSQNLGEEYWLALARAPCEVPVNLVRLLKHFGSPRCVFEAGGWAWRALSLKRELLNYLQNPNWYAVENDMRWLAQTGNHLLTLHHPNYPPFLREIYDPPLVLFVQGNCVLLESLQLAMVGTHKASREGFEMARDFAKCLSHQGLTITSGMALGIESASHWGALAGTGKTIAVAGWGLNRIYPAQHRVLVQKIAETGALVSEFPPDTPVRRKHFSPHCRIISGLSLGTLVIEAPKRSTALHTVSFAAEQGREVFAIPGSIHNPLVKGCHQLIKEGAKLVETVDDILKELLF
jgi:DNA processing protein